MAKIGAVSEIPKEVIFKWKIDFFSLSEEENFCYESPKFYFSGASWILKYFPNRKVEEESGWISLYLERRSSGTSVTVNYSIGFETFDGSIYPENICTSDFEEKYGCKGFDQLISREDLKNTFLFNSSDFTIVCLVKNSKPIAVADSLFSRQQTICDSLSEIYHFGRKTDLKLIFKDGEIRCHRAILEKRCSVLASEIDEGLKTLEILSYLKKYISPNDAGVGAGYIRICNTDIKTMHRLLIYLYSGDIENLTAKSALSLYTAARMYDISVVKSICSEFIQRNLTVTCVFDLLSCGEEELCRIARKYFTENANEILESENWNSFARENRDLSVELLATLVKTFLPNRKNRNE